MKQLAIVAFVFVMGIISYLYFFTDKFKSNKDAPPVKEPVVDPNSVSRIMKTETVISNPQGRWIVKGDKPQGRSCPMGQSTIWDGSKWVCAIRSGDMS